MPHLKNIPSWAASSDWCHLHVSYREINHKQRKHQHWYPTALKYVCTAINYLLPSVKHHQMWETPLCGTPTCETHSMGPWHYQFINFSMKNIHTSSCSDTVFCTSQVNTKKKPKQCNPSIQITLNVFPFAALTHLELPRNTLQPPVVDAFIVLVLLRSAQ